MRANTRTKSPQHDVSRLSSWRKIRPFRYRRKRDPGRSNIFQPRSNDANANRMQRCNPMCDGTRTCAITCTIRPAMLSSIVHRPVGAREFIIRDPRANLFRAFIPTSRIARISHQIRTYVHTYMRHASRIYRE